MRVLSIVAAAVALLFVGGSASAAPFQNGSFEAASAGNTFPSANSYTTFYAGSTAIAGWTVTSGSVDLIGTNSFWAASDGSYSLDMSGASAGTIQQSFDTMAGTTYDVVFDLSKNADANAISSATMRVAAGAQSQDYTFSKPNSLSNMMWTPTTFRFTATGASSTLSFQSLTSGVYGPALDNVRVTAAVAGVPEPATWATMILGLGLAGGAARRRRAALRLA